MKKYILLAIIFAPFFANAQMLEGIVYGSEGGEKQALPGVNIFWEGTTRGTASKANGTFLLKRRKNQQRLVFSFVGYKKKIIEVSQTTGLLEVVMVPNLELDEVTVLTKDRGTYLSTINPIQTENIGGAELHKAACCNLAESFETNPSIDLSYSDAITGAKQIKLLGLDGTYSLLQVENMPNLRGLATTFGLTYIPGPWLESIQVSKGAASVLNGYESIAGQINAELKKPDSSERLFLNLYHNSDARSEINANTNVRFKGDKVSSGIFIHAHDLSKENDKNRDNFLDDPLSRMFQFGNRWKYNNHKGHMAQAGFNLLWENRLGGQVGAKRGILPSLNNPYAVSIKNNRIDGFFKTGYAAKDGQTAFAWLSNFSRHKTNSYYGVTDYNADETRFYGSFVVTRSFDDELKHSLNSGVSFVYDDFNEILYATKIQRTEKVPGIFSEYTFKPNEKLTLMLGVRADFHNNFGTFVTPRMHFRYQINEHFTVRTSAGKGYRTANVLSENTYLLANARSLKWTSDATQEKAWNYGFAFIQNYTFLGRELTFNTEFFYTDFQSQLVVDRETSADYILLSPSVGKAYAKSLQFDLRWQPIERLDLLLAYRLNDIKQTIGGKLKEKPLANVYKGLINLNYSTPLKKWMFDYTIQFNGGGRIPSAPSDFDNTIEFPAYTVMNTQITKYFRYWNIYLGIENLTDFKQKNPISGAENPFGSKFNATNVWGPIIGRKIYLGLRFKLDYE